jgi:hypothetical protein
MACGQNRRFDRGVQADFVYTVVSEADGAPDYFPLTIAIYKLWLMWVFDKRKEGHPAGTSFDAKFEDLTRTSSLLALK